MSEKVNLFDILTGMNTYYINPKNGKRVNNGQRAYRKEQVMTSGLSIYHIMTYISATPQLLPVAQYLNEHYKTPLYDAYMLTFFYFQKLDIGNVKWIKKETINEDKDIEMIQQYYYVSRDVANSYLNRMSKKGIDRIKEFYDVGGKK